MRLQSLADLATQVCDSHRAGVCSELSAFRVLLCIALL